MTISMQGFQQSEGLLIDRGPSQFGRVMVNQFLELFSKHRLVV